MTPIEPSPDRRTSHPATIGYGIATASGVAIFPDGVDRLRT